MSESFAELFEESLSYTQMKPGSLVNASVIDVRSDFIIVSAGLKSEGVIPAEQFKNEKAKSLYRSVIWSKLHWIP